MHPSKRERNRRADSPNQNVSANLRELVMEQIAVEIDRQHRIELPLEIRQPLDLAAGDRLLATVRDGVILLIPRRGGLVEQLHGLYQEIWNIDVDAYLDEERSSWDRPDSE